ncbi:Zinc finger protein like [Actinidia chinensis var. chinensis]|uniref:Zinc finger protein like n=1 Tax=Actinidia chinensis var. chinensis TaxID=1590841 RepID=A0A2R6QT85_ACTCC|nr:Zinc finger protein like [Actinidia chinensis var. chinensis]
MYGHNHHSPVTYASTDFTTNFPLLHMTAPPQNFPSPPPLVIPECGEFDLMAEVAAPRSEVSYSSSGCSSYGSPSSLTSYSAGSPSLMQRSVSSLSLQKNAMNGFRHLAVAAEFTDSETSPVRKVFSTGDLQRIKMVQDYHRSESPLSNENSSIIEGMSKACRYSPEEKKERIERYRSKRNQRNFNKKIKYACRKTLADSRPRIRGRFARNDEIEKSLENQWSHTGGEEEYDEDEDNWINFLDSFSANLVP